MPFRHKSEYNISIGHGVTVKHKIDVQDKKISCTSIFVKELDNYEKKISGIF
jgi:hypothetical protein